MKANGRKKALALVGAIAAATALAAPSVEISNVQQQYPWTNTVDITYTVQGVSKTHQTNRLDHIVNDTYFATFEAKNGNTAIQDVDGNTVFTNGLVQGNGTFTAQWHPKTDLQLTGCTMTPSVFRGEEQAYLVINLETNKQGKCDWWYEPMSTQKDSNERYNTDLYKTKYMVFRRIKAGTYRIGAQGAKGYSDTSRNNPHDVKFPVDYFFALFGVTEYQYNLIMNKTATLSSTSCFPVNNISWGALRGSASRNVAPTQGFVFNIADRTGLKIDFPTHAMYETAIRGGTTNYWMGGTALSNKEYCECLGKGDGHRHIVGNYKPNDWGLFDILGVLHVYFLDMPTSFVAEEPQLENNFIPLNTGDATRMTYSESSSSWAYTDHRLSPSSWYSYPINTAHVAFGMRLAIYPESYYPNGGK